MATTEVILREKITNLGSEADVVTVKAGFARNYLVPEGKAYEATKANLKHLESLSAQRIKREATELQGAQEAGARHVGAGRGSADAVAGGQSGDDRADADPVVQGAGAVLDPAGDLSLRDHGEGLD